jgi:predicted RNase H-like HicB family nuclease
MLSSVQQESTMLLSAVIHREGKLFVSWCPEVDVASQGKSIEEALANLREAVELYLEDENVRPPTTPRYFTTFEVEHGKNPGPVRA